MIEICNALGLAFVVFSVLMMVAGIAYFVHVGVKEHLRAARFGRYILEDPSHERSERR